MRLVSSQPGAARARARGCGQPSQSGGQDSQSGVRGKSQPRAARDICRRAQFVQPCPAFQKHSPARRPWACRRPAWSISGFRIRRPLQSRGARRAGPRARRERHRPSRWPRKFSARISSASPGHTEGIMLAPFTRSRSVPHDRSTSPASAHFTVLAAVSTAASPVFQEVLRLCLHVLCVGPILPHESAVVSKTLSYRNAGF